MTKTVSNREIFQISVIIVRKQALLFFSKFCVACCKYPTPPILFGLGFLLNSKPDESKKTEENNGVSK